MLLFIRFGLQHRRKALKESLGGWLVDVGRVQACQVFQGSFSEGVWPAAATRRFAPARVAKPE